MFLKLTRLGWGLALPVVFLLAVGLLCIHSTGRSAGHASTPGSALTSTDESSAWAMNAYRAIGPLTVRQLIYIGTGVGLLLIVLLPSYQSIGRYTYALYALAIGLLLMLVLDRVLDHYGLPDMPLVDVRRGTRRWIGLGMLSIQPSEFLKPILVLTLARYLRYGSSYRNWRGLIVPFVLTLVPMVLIMFQPDLGTLLMLLPVLLTMLFVAGARLRHLLLVVLLGCATMPVFYFYGMKDYQRTRIDVMFKQNSANESWHMDEGYQLRQSKIALGTGGVAGEGYGEGIFVKYDGLLPEEHNDFIFAIIGHQWGLVGGVLVILAYSMIVLLGLEVATVTNDPFGRLLAVGVVVMIVVQALLNICMNIGLAPITGMTLPFVSAGGSSLWANFLALGLLVNVAQRRPMLIHRLPFEHTDDD